MTRLLEALLKLRRKVDDIGRRPLFGRRRRLFSTVLDYFEQEPMPVLPLRLLGSVSGSRLFENDRLALTQYSHLNCDWFEPWRETIDHVSLEKPVH